MDNTTHVTENQEVTPLEGVHGWHEQYATTYEDGDDELYGEEVHAELSQNDPPVCITLEGVVDDPVTRTLKPWAQFIVELFDSYTEWSASGTGLTILVRGSLPGPTLTRVGEGMRVEIRTQEPHATLTDQRVPGTPATIRDHENTGKLATFYEDQQDIQRLCARAACLGPLFEGDTRGYGGDVERATLALCQSLLADMPQNHEKVDWLVCQSGLMTRAWFHDEAYRQRILAAVSNPLIMGTYSLKAFRERPIPQPKSLLGEVFPEQSLAILFGKPGLGKSWLALELAFSVACGAPWHGLPTTAAKVLYLSLELPNKTAQERLKTLRGYFTGPCVYEEQIPVMEAWTQALDKNFHILTAEGLPGPIDIEDDNFFKHLKNLCQFYGLQLLVIDAFSRIHQADENSTQQIGRVLAQCDKLRLQTGCAILLVHHDRKGHGDKGGTREEMDVMRGSSRLQSDPQLLMHLTQAGKHVRLSFPKVSLGMTPAPIWLRQDEDGTFSTVDKPHSKEGKPEERKGEVLQCIQAAGASGITKQAIVEQTGVPEGTVERYLRELKKERTIQQTSKGKATRYIAIAGGM